MIVFLRMIDVTSRCNICALFLIDVIAGYHFWLLFVQFVVIITVCKVLGPECYSVQSLLCKETIFFAFCKFCVDVFFLLYCFWIFANDPNLGDNNFFNSNFTWCYIF